MHPRALRPAVILWAALALAAGGPAPAARSDLDLLVLEVRLGRLTLSDGLLAYLHPGGVLLPLGGIAAALEFPITVEPDTGIAHGWFLAENRRFSLDLARREVVVEGRGNPRPSSAPASPPRSDPGPSPTPSPLSAERRDSPRVQMPVS